MTAIECQALETARDGDSVLISLECIPASVMAYASLTPEQAMHVAKRLALCAHAASDVRDMMQENGDAA
jgi:hypothetical protein